MKIRTVYTAIARLPQVRSKVDDGFFSQILELAILPCLRTQIVICRVRFTLWQRNRQATDMRFLVIAMVRVYSVMHFMSPRC